MDITAASVLPVRTEPLTSEGAADRELVHRAQAGELSAYDDLVRRYQERIYATVCLLYTSPSPRD